MQAVDVAGNSATQAVAFAVIPDAGTFKTANWTTGGGDWQVNTGTFEGVQSRSTDSTPLLMDNRSDGYAKMKDGENDSITFDFGFSLPEGTLITLAGGTYADPS